MTDLISIVLPVHNEFLNLRSLIEEWDSELKKISKIQLLNVQTPHTMTKKPQKVENPKLKIELALILSVDKTAIRDANMDSFCCANWHRFRALTNDNCSWQRRFLLSF